MSGTHVHTATGTENARAIASCGAGERVLGGGFTHPANRDSYESAPAVGSALATDGQTPTGWAVTTNGDFTVYVICSNA